MNQYFRRKSRKYRKYLLVQSYHFCPVEYQEPVPVMLVDLCNDSLCREIIPGLQEKAGLSDKKRYIKTFPAVKIARLGRNIAFKNMGASIHLLNALKMFFTHNNRTGCRFLTLDAYPHRVGLYEKCGFIRTLAPNDLASGDNNESDRAVSMFFDLMPFAPEKIEKN